MAKRNYLGKILIGIVAIVVIVISLPFVLNNLFHISFKPTEGIIYTMDIQDNSALVDSKMAITFENDIMHIYTYGTSPFGELAGIRYDYRFKGESFYHIIGSLYIFPETSILPWKNYTMLDEGVKDKANIRLLLKGINTLNWDYTINGIDYDTVATGNITIGKDFLMLGELVLHQVGEDDTTDYTLQRFDRESKTLSME